MAQNIYNSISNNFLRILNLCKCNQEKIEKDHIEEIVSTSTIRSQEILSDPLGAQTHETQKIQEQASTEDIETVQNIPKTTYSEVLKQTPIIKQQNQTFFSKTTNELNPGTQTYAEYNNTNRGRNPRNRGNQNHTQTQERKCDYNRGGNRAGRSNRSRGRNRRGAARGQHINTNINLLQNRGYHQPRGNKERPNRGYRSRSCRGRGFVHGGITKSNNFRSSGIFSYSNLFSQSKDENNNKEQNGINKGQPVIFNYYIIKNYVRKDGAEDEATSEIVKTGSSKHFW